MSIKARALLVIIVILEKIADIFLPLVAFLFVSAMFFYALPQIDLNAINSKSFIDGMALGYVVAFIVFSTAWLVNAISKSFAREMRQKS
jgi:hypothetical protein